MPSIPSFMLVLSSSGPALAACDENPHFSIPHRSSTIFHHVCLGFVALPISEPQHTRAALCLHLRLHISRLFLLYTLLPTIAEAAALTLTAALLCPYLHRHPYTPFTVPAPSPVSYHTHLQPTPLPPYCLMHLHAIRLLNLPQRTPTPVR